MELIDTDAFQKNTEYIITKQLNFSLTVKLMLTNKIKVVTPVLKIILVAITIQVLRFSQFL